MSQAPDVVDQKKALRARMKAWRAGLDVEAIGRAAGAVAAQGLVFLRPQDGAIVSGFASLPDEFRIWPLLRRLHGQGYRLALPVMQGKAKPLLFRAWAPGDLMNKAVWGIPEPRAGKPVLEPDILLVPLLAFDACGGRLGYGGGFYDRTLATLRAIKQIIAVGLAYDEQRVDAVPYLDYDQRLDWVLTPSGPIRCQADASVVSR